MEDLSISLLIQIGLCVFTLILTVGMHAGAITCVENLGHGLELCMCQSKGLLKGREMLGRSFTFIYYFLCKIRTNRDLYASP